MPTSPTQWPDDPAPSTESGNFQLLMLAASAALPYIAADNMRLMLLAKAPTPSLEAARPALDSAFANSGSYFQADGSDDFR